MRDGLSITAFKPSARSLAAGLLFWLGGASLATAAEPVVVLSETHRHEVTPVSRGLAELLPIDAVVGGMGVEIHTDVAAGSVTLRNQAREIILYNNKSLASVAGDLRLLSSPTVLDGGRCLVPVDGLPLLLRYLLAKPVEWRAPIRVLLVGDVRVPKVQVSAFTSGDSVRVVLDASEKVPFHVLQGEGKVTVTIARDLLEVKLDQERVTGGIVEGLEHHPGKENTLVVTLGKRFHNLKAAEMESPPRLVLEFLAVPATASPAPPAAAAAGPEPDRKSGPAPADTRMPHIIVIDPGHGGPMVGTQGPAGALEKDVTLAIARKLKAAIVNLGFQAFLTRDKDEDVALDQRTAIANNFKADVFISIHANGSSAQGAKGSEVYFLAYESSDTEARRLAMAEGAVGGDAGATPGSDLALILWNMAQAEHLEESSALASRIHEALGDVTGTGARGVKQAPFRVLVGAAMPAVLVEVGFLSNADEEKLLVNDAYQNRVAGAILRGMSRYFDRHGGGSSTANVHP
jgi:N-acetylmuramoyl-L-alanine amidase